MRRREFLGMLGGAAAAWPLPGARAATGDASGRNLLVTSLSDSTQGWLTAFRRGLTENGYTEGRNVTVEYRWALGQYGRLPALAAELVRRPVAVLVATGGEAAPLAAKTETTGIPIVASFGSDPVEGGFVASLNRPGGNVTGDKSLAPASWSPSGLACCVSSCREATTVGCATLNPNHPPLQAN